MEIMRHIKNVYEKKGLLHYIYYYAPTLIFLIFFICEWSASEFDMSIISILKHSVFHILLLIVVYIWLRVTPYYYDYLHSLENVFENNPEYKEEYSKFVHRAEQFNLSYSSKSSWLKVIYLMAWLLFGAGFVYYIDYLGLLPPGRMRYLAVFFVVITLVLNFSSYFICMAFTHFIIGVTRIKELKYNVYMPSATYGFQKIKKAANITYLFFLADSFLCIFAYTYYVFLFGPGNDQLKNNILEFIYISLYMGVFGFWSFIIITFRVKFYLNRMYDSWKKNSIKVFQNRLYEAEKKNDEISINAVNELISNLQKDKMSVSGIEVVASFSTFVLNIISIASAVIVLVEGFLISNSGSEPSQSPLSKPLEELSDEINFGDT